MSHTINISDELWDAYDGSPSKMRDTLWQALVPTDEGTTPKPEEFQKAIVLQWDTRCSLCRAPLLAGETAMYRVPNEGGKQIVCMSHARDVQEMLELEAELS